MPERLEEVLDACIEQLRRGQGLEEVLRQYPHRAGQLRPLLELAGELSELPPPPSSPAAAVRAMVKASVRAAGEKTPAPRRRLRLWSRPVLLRAAAVLLVAFLGGWATVTASADALPGEWLYPVKRFTERARFFLTINPQQKAELRIVYSSERLKEAVRKHLRGQGLDRELLKQMLEEARLAAEESERLPEGQRELLATQAAYVSQYQQQVLEEYKSRASGEDREVLTRYARMCGRRAAWMRRMCRWGRDEQRPGSPGQPRRRWREMCPMWRD